MADVIARGSDTLDLGIDNTSWWMYWDRDELAVSSNSLAAGTEGSYFTQTNTKAANVTNWPTNGVLPRGFSALIWRVRIQMTSAGGANVVVLDEADVKVLSNNLIFELYKNVTDLKMQCPIASLGDPMNGISTAAETLSTITANGTGGLGTLPDFGQIEINSEEAISARIYAPAAITTATSSLSSVTYQVILDTKRWKAVS